MTPCVEIWEPLCVFCESLFPPMTIYSFHKLCSPYSRLRVSRYTFVFLPLPFALSQKGRRLHTSYFLLKRELLLATCVLKSKYDFFLLKNIWTRCILLQLQLDGIILPQYLCEGNSTMNSWWCHAYTNRRKMILFPCH